MKYCDTPFQAYFVHEYQKFVIILQDDMRVGKEGVKFLTFNFITLFFLFFFFFLCFSQLGTRYFNVRSEFIFNSFPARNI